MAGGENAGIESAPSTVSVQYLQEHVCNGVLITRRHVLTAASCVQEVLPDNVQVRVGSSRHDRGGALKNVHNIMIHPNFSQPIPNNNNIAVIHLRQPVPEGSLARPIAIASPESQLADNAAVQLAGWQLSNNEENEYSEQLQIAQLNTVARAQCATAHGNVAQGDQAVSRISDTMICATNPRLGGNSACTVSAQFVQYLIISELSFFVSAFAVRQPAVRPQRAHAGFDRIGFVEPWLRQRYSARCLHTRDSLLGMDQKLQLPGLKLWRDCLFRNEIRPNVPE